MVLFPSIDSVLTVYFSLDIIKVRLKPRVEFNNKKKISIIIFDINKPNCNN